MSPTLPSLTPSTVGTAAVNAVQSATPSFADWSSDLINRFGQATGLAGTPPSPSGYNDMVGANSNGQGSGVPSLTSLDSAPQGIQAAGTPGTPFAAIPGQVGQAIGNAAQQVGNAAQNELVRESQDPDVSSPGALLAKGVLGFGGMAAANRAEVERAYNLPPGPEREAALNQIGLNTIMSMGGAGEVGNAAEQAAAKVARPLVDEAGQALGGVARDVASAVPRFYHGEGTAAIGSYPIAPRVVDGLVVRPDIPNLASIGASVDGDYHVLRGIREVSMGYFDAPPAVNPRTKALAAQIKASGEINPLIVAIDEQGPYILEGAHRYDALQINGARSFPAVVVAEETARPVPLNAATSPAGDVTRMYHGTGSAFQTPDGAKFDPNGLFGPGYYLTSDPRVASSYATNAQGSTVALQKDLDGYLQRKAAGNLSDRQAYVVDQQIAKLQAQLQAVPAAGPNVRAVNVPKGLNMLNADAPVTVDQARAVSQSIVDPWVRERFNNAVFPNDDLTSVNPNVTGADLHHRLDVLLTARKGATVQEGQWIHAVRIPDPEATTSTILQRAGYDGITYNGGKRIPLMDEAGQPIEHQATVIFPESLPKIRNAISGLGGGTSVLGDTPAPRTLAPYVEPKAVPNSLGADGKPVYNPKSGKDLATTQTPLQDAYFKETRFGRTAHSNPNLPPIDAAPITSADLVDAQKTINSLTPNRAGTYPFPAGWKDNPAQHLAQMRADLVAATKEGAGGRYWYEEGGKNILAAFNGDKDEAEKFVTLLAIYSPRSDVIENTQRALRVWSQYKAWESLGSDPARIIPLQAGGMGQHDIAATNFLYHGIEVPGIKRNAFFANTMAEVNPTKYPASAATIDTWENRLMGHPELTKVIPEPNHVWMQGEISRVRQQLNADLPAGAEPWTDHQVQAAGWNSIRSRHEIQTGALKTSLPDALAQGAEYHFGSFLDQSAAQASWESAPGKTSGSMPGYHDPSTTWKQKMDYQAAVTAAKQDPNGGGDQIAKALGQISGGRLDAPGYFEGASNPGSQEMLRAPASRQTIDGEAHPELKNTVEGLSARQLDAYIALNGMLGHQDSMAWTRRFPTRDIAKANLVSVDVGRPLSHRETVDLGAALDAVYPGGSALIAAPDGAHILNIGGEPNPAFHARVQHALDRVESDDGVGARQTAYQADNHYIENDWRGAPNGEDYAAAIGDVGRSQRVVDAYNATAERYAKVSQDFARQNGWGPVRPIPRWDPSSARPSIAATSDLGRTSVPSADAARAATPLPGSAQDVTVRSPATIGGGVLGAAYGATQGNTPEERAKNAALYGGVGLGGAFAAERIARSPAIAGAINELIAPARNAPADVQKALRDFANRNLQVTVDAETKALEAKKLLGPQDKAAAASMFERTGQFSANPTTEQQILAAKTENYMLTTGILGRQHGYLNGDVTAGPGNPVQAYFPHIYQENLTPATARASKAGLNPSDFYSNSRVYPTLQDAQAAGLHPVDSVSGPLQHYAQRIGSSEAKYQLVQDLKNASPAAVVNLPQGGKVPDGFVPGAAVAPQFQGVAFQEDVAKAVKNILNPSAFRSTAIGRAFLGAQSIGKEVLFTLTGFHQLTELRQAVSAVGIKGVPVLGRAIVNAFSPRAFESLRLGEADGFSQAARAGVTGLTGDTVTLDTGDRLSPGKAMAVRSATGAVAGGASGYVQAKGAGEDDQTALQHGLIGAGMGALAGPVGKVVSDSLWTRQVPTLKYLTWKIQVASGRDPEAAAAFVNNVYGGQNLAAIARSKTVQDALRTTTLAPDWWESWSNQIGNAFKGGDEGGQARAFWARTAVASAFTLEGLNYALNGRFTDQNDPDHRFELDLKGLYDHLGITQRNPKTGVPESTYMNVLPGPILSLLDLSSGNVGKFAMGRFATLPRVAAQAMSNRDFRGQEIVPPYTPLPEAIARQGANAVSQIAPIGGQQIQYSGTNNEPAGLTAFSTGTGLRTAHPSAMPPNGPLLSSATRNLLATAGVTINPSVGQSVAMLAPEHVNGIALARDERQTYQDQINKGVDAALQTMTRQADWSKASPEQRQQLVDTAISNVTRREGLAVLRRVPQAEVETRLSVAKNGPAAAAYAWQHVPHYEGVGGTPQQIYQKNLDIEAAKSTLARYTQIYGDADLAEYHLGKDDKAAAKLSQYPDLDAEYLSYKRAAIDKRFNGDLTKAQRLGLVEVGTSAAPVP